MSGVRGEDKSPGEFRRSQNWIGAAGSTLRTARYIPPTPEIMADCMSLLEKIIYMADYIEPNRDFPGLEELRRLAYEDLDQAMILGLEMSLEDLRSYGIEPHAHSQEALTALRTSRSGQ